MEPCDHSHKDNDINCKILIGYALHIEECGSILMVPVILYIQIFLFVKIPDITQLVVMGIKCKCRI